MIKRSILSLTSAAVLATGMHGVAHANDPADVVEYRQAVFQVTKNNFGPIADMLKGDIEYDQEAIKKMASVVEMMSTLVEGQFPEGTGPLETETNALMDIWDEPEAFGERIAEFEQTAVTLVEAANSGDKRQLAAAVKDVGASCKACHDDFRRDD
ncbi:c-type cytochrome [Guyparkeria sp.]|uniref:c-type cytochrome n=1 Tax=Guyparkeria sp. TaxID=2035736 RepID=UPI0039706678